MFGKTWKINIGGTEEAPTATFESCSVVEGIMASLTSLVDDNVAVSGLGHTAFVAAVGYGSALATNRVLSGKFHLNPFSVK